MIELFLQGGWVMYVILCCSLASWATILERLVHFFATRVSKARLSAYLQGPSGAPATGALAPFAALRQGLASHPDATPEDRDRLARRLAAPYLNRDNRGLALLAAVAGLAPLLGLLGTVLGLIELFRALEASGAKPEFSHLIGGIWTALLTTAFGMLVAVPASAAYQAFDHWAGRRAQALQDFLGLLEEGR